MGGTASWPRRTKPFAANGFGTHLGQVSVIGSNTVDGVAREATPRTTPLELRFPRHGPREKQRGIVCKIGVCRQRRLNGTLFPNGKAAVGGGAGRKTSRGGVSHGVPHKSCEYLHQCDNNV